MADKATKLSAEVDELMSQDKPDVSAAMTKAGEALAIYKDLKDVEGQMEVQRKMISAKVMDGKNEEARKVAQDAIDAATGDAKAAAYLLLAEACMSTLKTADALAAAKEGLNLYKASGDKEGTANALQMVATAGLTDVESEAVSAATERVDIYKEMGDASKTGYAQLLLSQVHVTRIGLKLSTCAIASADDSMAGLTAAKDANASLSEAGDREGAQGALDLMARVLMYNGVPSHVIERLSDPEDVFQDVLSGKYSTTKNGLPAQRLPQNLKLEEVIPSSKQLERGKFTWNNPLGGYCYTLMWQAAKERQIPNSKLRGSYDIMALNTEAKTGALPVAFTTMANDAAERNTSMVVYMTSHNAAMQMGTQIITQTATLSAMITARLSKITFIQFNESHVDWLDTRARQVNVYPVTLALMRSCRIEAPTVSIGYVSGDATSWVADPAPLIESMFDTLESDECELMYKRGEAFAPLIIHRAMDDGVMYCKPKRGKGVLS